MKTAPEIDFAALETDVDFAGCVPSPVTDDDGLGVETRYARLTFLLGNDQFVAVVGDYADCYIEIRIPRDVLKQFLAEEGPPPCSDA